ncbi:MAG TPA: ABC transporter ATP-binding protein [Thermomicrobiales bacterium]|nr:ABC transporter ATP-binding protein [Thermomicrobiales bacterium]
MEADRTQATAATTSTQSVWEHGEDPAASQGDPILRIENIDAAYGKVRILHGVSMVVHPGEAVSIIGPNGAGKSTVLKAVIGQLTPSSGAITFNGINVVGMRPEQIIRHGMAVVPQGRIVFERMTVVENLEMGAYSLKDKSRVPVLMERIFDLFPRLAERKRQEAGTMSGGEQQMLAMGRGLMSDPKMVLMDEPSLGLAPMFVELIFEQIGVLKKNGLTLLLVEQNAVKSLSISDRAYVLELGRNRFTGSGEALLADPRVRQLYLGG